MLHARPRNAPRPPSSRAAAPCSRLLGGLPLLSGVLFPSVCAVLVPGTCPARFSSSCLHGRPCSRGRARAVLDHASGAKSASPIATTSKRKLQALIWCPAPNLKDTRFQTSPEPTHPPCQGPASQTHFYALELDYICKYSCPRLPRSATRKFLRVSHETATFDLGRVAREIEFRVVA